MFTSEQIQSLRDENFLNIHLKSVSINDKGDKNGINIDFFIEEQLDNLKIFKNNNKDKIKIKVFLLRDNIPLVDLNSTSSIITLNNLLINNNAEYQDIYASADYLNRSQIMQDYISNTLESIFKLNYKTYFELSKKNNIDNLSVGFMMYYDEKEYAKELNIDVKLLETSFLSGNLFLFSLKQNKRNVSNGKLQDFSTLKNILETPEKLQKILESIEIGANIKKFSDQKINIKKKFGYFSEIYPSIQENGNLNFLFFVNVKKIIKDNSFLKKLKIDKNSLKQLEKIAEETSEITSLSITRKQYSNDLFEPSLKQKEKKNKKKVAKKINDEMIVSSKDDSNNIVLLTKINKNPENYVLSSIKEIIGLSNGMRAFEVVDSTAYKIKNTTFEYGINISISDYFYSYMNSLIEILYSNENIFKKYINDTYIFGNYNYSTDTFNESYVNSKFLTISNEIRTALSHFITVLKILGIIKNETEVLETLNTLLSAESTTQQNLIYFLEFYSRTIQKIKKDLDVDGNKSIKINSSLKSTEVIDSSKNPKYGYGYLHRKKDNSIGLLDTKSSILEKKISSDIAGYMSNTSPNFGVNIHYSVAPSYICVNGNKKFFSRFEENTNTYSDIRKSISQEFYIDLDVNVKTYLCSNQSPPNDSSVGLNYIKNINSSLSNILNINNVTIENFYNSSDSDVKKSLGINENIRAEQLLLAMSKIELPTKFLNNLSQMPFHIKSFIDRSSNFFELQPGESTSNSLNIINDLNKNSKFLFLYNTICKVQYLSVEDDLVADIKRYTWKYLTSNNINSLEENKILCRLVLYQNRTDNFNNFYEIEMPFYDKYFIVEVENERFNFPKISRKQKTNAGNYNKQQVLSRAKASSAFSSLSQVNNSSIDRIFNRITPKV